MAAAAETTTAEAALAGAAMARHEPAAVYATMAGPATAGAAMARQEPATSRWSSPRSLGSLSIETIQGQSRSNKRTRKSGGDSTTTSLLDKDILEDLGGLHVQFSAQLSCTTRASSSSCLDSASSCTSWASHTHCVRVLQSRQLYTSEYASYAI